MLTGVCQAESKGTPLLGLAYEAGRWLGGEVGRAGGATPGGSGTVQACTVLTAPVLDTETELRYTEYFRAQRTAQRSVAQQCQPEACAIPIQYSRSLPVDKNPSGPTGRMA